METYFDDKKIRNNIVIKIGSYWSVDELCSIYLLKIFLALKYNKDVYICSSHFKGSEIFLVSDYEVDNKDVVINVDCVNNTLIVDNEKIKVTCFSLSEYFFKLLVKYDFIVDYELIGFYTLLSYKLTTLNLNQDKQKLKFLKLLNIMNEESFYTLEHNVDQVVEKLDDYMV